MTIHFTAYIDEAGDEGIGKLRQSKVGGQSKWFIVGGIVVRQQNDVLLPKWRDEVLSLFPKRQSRVLHFRELNHVQKVATCDLLSHKRFGIIAVCSNKVTLTATEALQKRYSTKGFLYNYLTRFLLERLTHAVSLIAEKEGETATLNVIFSRRANTDYESMKDYLCLMRDGREKMPPVRSISWQVFDPVNIKVENHSRWAGLQIADICTSATAAGLEPNGYGHYEPRYAMQLSQRFVAIRGSRTDWGLTVVPRTCPMDNEQRRFINNIGRGDGPLAPDARR